MAHWPHHFLIDNYRKNRMRRVYEELKEKNQFSLSYIFKQRSFWLGVIIPFFLTLGLYQGYIITEKEEAHERFEKEGARLAAIIAEKIERYEDVMFALQSFFASSQSVDTNEWNDFINSTLSHSSAFPGVQNISYIAYVPKEHLNYFLNDIHKSNPNFEISQQSTNPILCPRVYTHPQGSETYKEGLDLCTNERNREILNAIENWKKTNIVATSRNDLRFILPLYGAGRSTETQEDAKPRLKGWISLDLHMPHFISSFFKSEENYISITLIDRQKETLVYSNPKNSLENLNTYSIIYDIGNAQIKVTYFESKNSFDLNEANLIGMLILGLGSLLSLISGLLVWSFNSTQGRAMHMAEEMNKHIKDREARIRHLMDTTPGAIYSCTPDDDRTVTFLSDYIEIITGHPASFFIGQSTSTYTKLIHPEDRKVRADAILSGIEEEKKFACEYRLIDTKGHEKWLYEQGHVVYDDHGRPEQIVGTVLDITSRKIAEEAAAQLNLALENAAECIGFLDPHLTFSQVNPSFAELTGRAQNDMIGLGLSAIIHPDEVERVENLYESSLHQPKVRSEVHCIKANGSSFYVSMTFVTSYSKNGYLNGTYVFARDVTQRKQVEEELRKAKDAALEASRSKSDFLAMMSHELRTPLNAIIGYSDLLAEQMNQEKRDDNANDLYRIKEAGQHLLTLINDILDVSKLEAGKTEIFTEIFAIDDIVLNVRGMAQPLMTMNNNQFLYEADENLGFMNSDFVKIRQNLLNLLSNAAKFTDNGTITFTIRIEKENQDDWIVFSIKDTGCGITPEQLTKLFKPFTQADSSTTRKFGGTGLGLTLVKQYSEMLGGNIIVESTLNQGTTFIMRIPRGNVDEIAHSA